MSTDRERILEPKRACPVLESMRRGLTDALPERKRALLPAPSGTADDGSTEVRVFMALDWLIRVYLPSFLELSPKCREYAERVRALDRIVDLSSVERADPVVQQARTAALAAVDADRQAVDDAVMRAITSAAWSATWAAAWVGAASAADDNTSDDAITVAVWTVVETARLAAVSGTARAAVRAAVAAAADVPEDAIRQAAVRAAWDVARGVLGPTVESLQDSAIALYADMIDARLRGGAR